MTTDVRVDEVFGSLLPRSISSATLRWQRPVPCACAAEAGLALLDAEPILGTLQCLWRMPVGLGSRIEGDAGHRAGPPGATRLSARVPSPSPNAGVRCQVEGEAAGKVPRIHSERGSRC